MGGRVFRLVLEVRNGYEIDFSQIGAVDDPKRVFEPPDGTRRSYALVIRMNVEGGAGIIIVPAMKFLGVAFR